MSKSMTLSNHIDEVRRRLIYCAVAVVVGFVVSFIFIEYILKILIMPVSIDFIYVDITEMFMVYMQVCFTTAIILSFPVLLFQLISFVFPALTAKEKGYVFIAIPFAVILFVGGVVFGYYVLIPPAVQFLTSFGLEIATPQIRIGNYISLVTRLLFAVGLVFEIPVVAVLLAKLGVISSKKLLKQWRWAIVVSFILGAIITPTWDLINQSLVAIPIFVLYLLSIVLVKLVEINKRKENNGTERY